MWEEVREKKRRSGRIQLKSNKSICKDEKCGKLNDAGKTICDDCGGPNSQHTHLVHTKWTLENSS